MEETSSALIIPIIYHSVLRHPSEHQTSSNVKYLLAQAHIAKLNELTKSEVTELTSLMVNETALAILRRQGSWGITTVTLQMEFIFDISIVSIFAEVTDKILQTGSEGLWNCWITPRHLESLPYITIFFGSHLIECYIKPRATTVGECITKRVGAAVSQYAEQCLPEGITSGSRYN